MFGDPTKFGLGFISVLFDIFFMLQHYVFYRQKPQIDAEPLVGEDSDCQELAYWANVDLAPLFTYKREVLIGCDLEAARFNILAKEPAIGAGHEGEHTEGENYKVGYYCEHCEAREKEI